MTTTYWVAEGDRLEAADRDTFADRPHEFIYVAVGDDQHFIGAEYVDFALVYVIEEGALQIRPTGGDANEALRVYGSWSWVEFRRFQTQRTTSSVTIM